MLIGTYISITTLKVNGLNAPTKRHRRKIYKTKTSLFWQWHWIPGMQVTGRDIRHYWGRNNALTVRRNNIENLCKGVTALSPEVYEKHRVCVGLCTVLWHLVTFLSILSFSHSLFMRLVKGELGEISGHLLITLLRWFTERTKRLGKILCDQIFERCARAGD